VRTVEEQLADVLTAVRHLPSERIPIDEALGRTVTEPVLATVPIPVFDNSAMDGYAVRITDIASASDAGPVALRIVGDVPAGSAADPAIGPGETVRIMTGAPMPTDADGVVPVEDTVEGFSAAIGATVRILEAPRAGAHIRRAAADAAIGDEVVAAGTLVTPLQASALAAASVASVVVARRPRVAIISTGSELRRPGTPLLRGQIPESNSLVLLGLVADTGAEIVLRESVSDDPADLVAAIARAFDRAADVVIMSGGVSEGAYEPVKQALSGRGAHGAAMTFDKVAMQPGKPQGFGVSDAGALLFGFPGNPVSVAVSFECFARPALLAMQGRADLARPRITLTAATAWRTPPGRRQYLPAAIDRSDPAAWTVRPATAGGSGSHLAGGLARAEAFAIVPAGVEAVLAGDPIDVMLLS
jgi:molybdopterin molybdotransferase